jgi:hypothetical protein
MGPNSPDLFLQIDDPPFGLELDSQYSGSYFAERINSRRRRKEDSSLLAVQEMLQPSRVLDVPGMAALAAVAYPEFFTA